MNDKKIVISVNVSEQAVKLLSKKGFNISALVNQFLETKAEEVGKEAQKCV